MNAKTEVDPGRFTTAAIALGPWLPVWLGMYVFNNIWLTFALYHGLLLLPVSLMGRRYWSKHLKLPSWHHLAGTVTASAVTCLLVYVLLKWSGSLIVDRERMLASLTSRGFVPALLPVLSVYFVVVNPVLEELFWRGTLINRLPGGIENARLPGLFLLSLAFAAWHYLPLRALLSPGFAELTVLAMLAAGCFETWLYRKTESIILPTIWHALVFDLPIILVLWWLSP